MHHGEAFVASEGGGESRRVGDVALHELAVLYGLPMAGQQIVEDNDAVAGTVQRFCRMAADVAGAAGDQNRPRLSGQWKNR